MTNIQFYLLLIVLCIIGYEIRHNTMFVWLMTSYAVLGVIVSLGDNK